MGEPEYLPPGREWNPPFDHRDKVNRKYQDIKFDNTSKTVDWYKFKAAFDVAVASKPIRSSEKLLHLLGLLEGDPAIIAHRIAGDEYTTQSYLQVWSALESQFGGVYRQRQRLHDELRKWPKMTEFTHRNTLELTSLIAQITRVFTRLNEAHELDSTGTINMSVQSVLPQHEAKRYFSWISRERLPNNLHTLYEFLESERAALAHAAVLFSTDKPSAKTFTGQDLKSREDDEKVSGSFSKGETLLTDQNCQTRDKQGGDTQNKNVKPCEMCQGSHRLWTCPDFKASTIPIRFKTVQEKRLCFHCLNDGHRAKACTFKKDIKCGINECDRYHHRLLHQDKEKGLIGIEQYCTQQDLLEKEEQKETSAFSSGLSTLSTGGEIYDAIRTVPAFIVSSTGQKEKIWVALDSCSTSTNIDADTAKRLKLKVKTSSVDRSIGVLQSSVNIMSDIVTFSLQTIDGRAIYPVEAYTVQNLIAGTPVVDWSKVSEEFPHLQNATIPKTDKRDRVRVLLGIDHNHLMIASRNLQGREDEPFAEYCKLGWSFSGRVRREHVINRMSDGCGFTQSFALFDQQGPSHKLVKKSAEQDLHIPDGPPREVRSKTEEKVELEEKVLPTFQEESLTTYENLPESINLTQEESDELNQLLQKNWELEAVGLVERVPRFSGDIKEKPVKNWTKAEIELDDRLKCVYLPADKQFQISIPWRQGDKPHFQNNRDSVVKRTTDMFNKLQPHQQDKVRDIFKGYEEKGYIRKLAPGEIKEADVFYLPFFCVKKDENPTTPVRIVWDCAAKYFGRSLNSEIELTPNRLQDLFKLLLRVRKYRYVVMSDISEMFLRIKLDPGDRRYHRFHFDGNDWEWISILFGNNASPNASQKVISVNCDVNGDGLPEAVESVKESCYMDDVADSRADEERAVQLALQLIKLFSFCNMPVHKFYSNSEKVCRALPANLLAKQITFDENTDDLVYSVGKVLGMSYSVEEGDVFTYAGKFRDVHDWTNVPSGRWTKTDIARISASIFDPLGLISPFTVRAKIVMQLIWRTKKETPEGMKPIDWTDVIPENIATIWESWLDQVFEIPNIKIPRWTHLEEIGTKKHAYQLHTFCDASEEGVCVASYIRVKTRAGIVTTLLAAKSRVTPLKAESISRLELVACVLAVRVCSVIRETYPALPEDTFYWTDSEVCLHWLNMSAKSFKAFVAHRVGEIQNYSEPRQWQHVPGIENPADIGTRPVTAAELKDHKLWWEGPEFLKLEVQHWPKSKILREIESNELKADIFVTTLFLKERSFTGEDEKDLHPRNFSVGKIYNGYVRIVRKLAFVFLFVRLFRGVRNPGKLSAIDFTMAKNHLFRQGQLEFFPEEIGIMSKTFVSLAKSEEVRTGKMRHSPILQLNPFLDPSGVMRSSSRLRVQKGANFEFVCPIILHRKSEIARLIVEDAHVNFAHPVSTSMMKAKLRNKFIILGLGKLIREIRANCTVCKKARDNIAQQQMAKLPIFRQGEKLKAFDSVGIDFAGPFSLRVGRGKIRKKSYILVMTCMTIRAVHLEATGGMETVHVVNALSRFCDVRGVPTKIVSDNQTSFTRANKDLIDWYASVDWSEVERKTSFGFHQSNGIEWIFNPPHAPHFGGAFEIMVKAVKRALKECVTAADLDEEEFRTCVSKVASILNNRPIQAFVPLESEDFEILTPNHFLISNQGDAIFPPDIPEGQRTLGVRLRLQDEIQKHIWRRFQKELVPLLAPRKKWKIELPELKPDDIVIEIDENAKRGDWKMRRVHSVIKSDDGMIRKVELFSPEGRIYLRPISRCIPIC